MTQATKSKRCRQGLAKRLPGALYKLHRTGQYLDVYPAVPDLDQYLYTVEHTILDGSEYGQRVVAAPSPLVWPQEDRLGNRYTQTYAGLEPLVRELLEARGFVVSLKGKRPAALPPPDGEKLEVYDPVDAAALDLVRQHDRGLVRYDPACVRPARLIAQIARAWPKARIIVTATRVNDARALRKELEHDHGFPRVGLFTSEHHSARGGPLVVATYNHVSGDAVEIERRDIYIALNPTALFASPNDSGTEALKRLRRARVYGLLADGGAVVPHQRSWLTALFGVEDVYVPRHGHKPLPVDVVFTRIAGGSRPPNHKDDVVLKRSGIWRHHLRNRRLAHLFLALAGADRGVLRKRFPDVAAQVRGKLKAHRVGLLVENVEHGLELARLLPGVPLVAAKNVWTEGLSAQELKPLELARSKRRRTQDPVLVTGDGLPQAGRFDILVRADGGGGLPALPDDWLAVPWGEETRLLLVDCNDRHHPVLRRWSRQRRRAYAEAGWSVAGVKEMTPLEKFMAERPGVCP